MKSENVQDYLSIVYKQIFELATTYQNEEQTTQYFEYASELMNIVNPADFTMFLLNTDNALLKKVETGLYSQKHETSAENLNHLLVGYLMLMKKLVPFSSLEEKSRMINFLLFKCFFPHF